jgi:hypothetical protein
MFLKSLRKVFSMTVIKSFVLFTLEHVGVVHSEKDLAISLGRPQ